MIHKAKKYKIQLITLIGLILLLCSNLISQVVIQGVQQIGTANFTGAATFANGTSVAPSISFTSDTGTGFYHPFANNLSVMIAGYGTGAPVAAFGPTGLTLAGTSTSIGFASGIDATGAKDSGISRIGASSIGIGNGTAGDVSGRINANSLGLGATAVLSFSGVAPTISSGFGTGASVPNNNGTPAFTVNVGTGGTATAGIITVPAAANGWNCSVSNITAKLGNRTDQTVQTASSTTTVSVQNQTSTTGAAVAWTASDILRLSCFAF
jgi:hypothetical protein